MTWKVLKSTASSSTSSLALIIHTPAKKGEELYNNYGPKPNAELVLGYGFSIENNPDDTIRLKISGFDYTSELGLDDDSRHAFWDLFTTDLLDDDEDVTLQERLEQELECVERLSEMVQDLIQRLPQEANEAMRPEVATMWTDYVGGSSLLVILKRYFRLIVMLT